MRNNVYRFQPDKPTVIRLKYKTGKPFTMGDVSGFTYTMGNGLTVRFPIDADTAIQALRLDAGQPFKVTKRTLTTGEYAWDIERVVGEPPPLKVDRPLAHTETLASNHSTIPPGLSENVWKRRGLHE